MSPLMSRDIVPVTGFCEYGDYPSGSVEDRDFLDHLNDYHLLKKVVYYVQTVLLDWRLGCAGGSETLCFKQKKKQDDG
jgi:hypothetical protein